MNLRIFAVLFLVIFLLGTLPMLLVQPTGSASAGLSAGFTLPIQNIYNVAIFIAIGLLAAWLGEETSILLPMCALLMLSIGGLMQIDDHQFPKVHDFIVGSIILLAMGASLLRSKAHLLAMCPIIIWAYFSGELYMKNVPLITTPLYFLLGIIINIILLVGIGVSLGVTLTGYINRSMDKLKTLPAISSFLSFF